MTESIRSLGTFAGLPEGATIPNFLNSGQTGTITYHGGDGNDVAVTLGRRRCPRSQWNNPPARMSPMAMVEISAV